MPLLVVVFDPNVGSCPLVGIEEANNVRATFGLGLLFVVNGDASIIADDRSDGVCTPCRRVDAAAAAAGVAVM